MLAEKSPLAEEFADAAGAVVRGHSRREIKIDIKRDGSPVTIADREAEAAMRRILGDRRPDDGVVGEVFGNERAGAQSIWVADPIDGRGNL